MTGVPKCPKCGHVDEYSSARRRFCEVCHADLWGKE